jgi:Glyoxalase/Bleomycin resistance protein/Dioxygenase superfamily
MKPHRSGLRRDQVGQPGATVNTGAAAGLPDGKLRLKVAASYSGGAAMSRLFGPMRQIGIVVRDIEKAMRHWVEVCGVGPWFYAEQLPMDEFRYRGRRYDLKVSIALANSGDIQLELIQQRCDSPSLYRDFLAAGHEGMQHWSSWPENYHEIRERALKSGWEIGQEGDTPRGPFIYFLNEGHPGTVIEMAEATPTRMRIFDAVREAAIGWDGRDPIRMNWPQG